MKNVIARLMVAGCALAGSALYAQDRGVVADVPFAFYMGDKALPQGRYQIDELKNGTIVTLHSATSVNSITSWEIAGNKEQEAPRLVFTCYNGACFLNQVWPGYSSRGIALPHTKKEKELASNGHTATLAVIKLVAH